LNFFERFFPDFRLNPVPARVDNPALRHLRIPPGDAWLCHKPTQKNPHLSNEVMNAVATKRIVARCLLAFCLLAGLLNAAVGDVSPLSRADIGQVEAVLTKNLKGKPTVQSGTKQEVDGGWKITCVATVGSGGDYDLVVMTEKSMVLGYIESQKPRAESTQAAPRGAETKSSTKKT
jgi:hypothetical protein